MSHLINFEGKDWEKGELIRYLIAMRKKVMSDKVTPNRAVGFIMLRDVMQHFTNESGPDGKWKPLKYRKIGKTKSGKRGRGILQDTGIMRNSISISVDESEAKVGTNIIYARTHHYGDNRVIGRTSPLGRMTAVQRNIPARPFMWLTDDAFSRAEKAYFRWLAPEGEA